MGEQDPATQALIESFQRERAKVAAHPPREPRWQRLQQALPWLIAVVVVIFILAPIATIVIYPRLGPVDTMTAFCNAEAEGDYDTAYALLSKRAQEHISPDAFTQASEDSNLSTCGVNHGIPLIIGGTKASLDAHYGLLGDSSGVDGSMSFVHEDNGWRVDSMTPDLLHLSS